MQKMKNNDRVTPSLVSVLGAGEVLCERFRRITERRGSPLG